jgi:hypothetical protein
LSLAKVFFQGKAVLTKTVSISRKAKMYFQTSYMEMALLVELEVWDLLVLEQIEARQAISIKTVAPWEAQVGPDFLH